MSEKETVTIEFLPANMHNQIGARFRHANGTIYRAEVGKITDVRVGIEGHGMFGVGTSLSWSGGISTEMFWRGASTSYDYDTDNPSKEEKIEGSLLGYIKGLLHVYNTYYLNNIVNKPVYLLFPEMYESNQSPVGFASIHDVQRTLLLDSIEDTLVTHIG